ncbi:hypothetical protein GALMADRAFT_594629 [Galerina marginata CBS 339.88]|uniref:Uncharacterized protein n=1 Tax=Galerina marginata (strain CBS 339.88) TaxID=685588 RepID=A0A067SV89_GALM3|nr:hypothetical protein GALMADRAFT_594629 [Galerina marginata CBS 339.88]
MAASHTSVFFLMVAFGAILLCSIGICALSATLLSWLSRLSPSQRNVVEGAFKQLMSTLLKGLGASLVYLVSFILFFALVPIQKARDNTWLGPVMGCLWVIAITISIFYCTATQWHPCSTVSRLRLSLEPVAIPGALNACREIMALNILFLVSFACVLGLLLASCQIDDKKPRTLPAGAVQANNHRNINNDPAHDDNEVDLGELGHHLSVIDEV